MKSILNTLYITTDGSYLKLEGETIIVSVEREKKAQIPLHHIGNIVCIGRSINLSPALMQKCMGGGMGIVWLTPTGRFQARVEGSVNGNILLRQAQFRAADNPQKVLALSQAFISGKLKNSRATLMRSARDNKDKEEKEQLVNAAKALAINLRNLEYVDSPSSVLGLEGSAATVYFDQLNIMIKPAMRKDFKYNGRTRRPPRDNVNALLSFLYALLANDCKSALETVGLDSQLGFFHTVRPGRHSLALDLQEEFRAVLVDRLALTLINRGQIKKKDFDYKAGGSVLLNDSGRKAVIIAYQERKKESLHHPVLEKSIEIGLLPLIQARLLARYLRNDIEAYVPFLYR